VGRGEMVGSIGMAAAASTGDSVGVDGCTTSTTGCPPMFTRKYPRLDDRALPGVAGMTTTGAPASSTPTNPIPWLKLRGGRNPGLGPCFLNAAFFFGGAFFLGGAFFFGGGGGSLATGSWGCGNGGVTRL